MSASEGQMPKTEVSGKDAEYEDDFEDELDSFISTSEDKKTTEEIDNKSADQKLESLKAETSDSQPEKGTEEIEKGQKEYSTRKRQDSENEEDEYSFSDDQRRAMMEMMLQRQESDLPDEDPPEYDVKDRLIQLNAELAKESEPEERQHKVGFKETLVDLVAPPPDFTTDDETSERDAQSPAGPRQEAESRQKSPEVPEKEQQSEGSPKKKKKTVVVERDGKFEVVNIEDLTPDEREMYDVWDSESPVMNPEPKKTEKNSNNSNIHAQSKQPAPPRKPRPATANGSASRRQFRPAQNKERPKSAATQGSQRDSSLENYNYNSPYALSPKQKELAEQRSKVLEEKRKEEEKRKRHEKEEEERANQEAFEAWLKHKREEDRKKKIEDDEKKKKEAKEDKGSLDSTDSSDTRRQRQLRESQEVEEPTLETYEPLFQKEENEEAYKEWLKVKRSQVKREKLLKRRQDQEMKDCYHVVSRDECDRAFKDWLKKKNSETRKARAVERQRSKSARSAAKRSRKNAALLRAIRNSQSFQYVDYYGYKF